MPSSLPTSIFRRSNTSSRWRLDRPSSSKLSSEHLDIWEHAALLYHGYEWQDAADSFQHLARQISDRELRTVCTLNAGLIQARLGDFADAARTIEAAAKGDETFMLTPYLLGIVEWELGNIIKAEACLEVCLQALRGGDVSYVPHGLDFLLQAENVHRQLKILKQAPFFSGSERPTSLVAAVLSADCIFEAPPRATKTRASTMDEQSKSIDHDKEIKRHSSPDLRRNQQFPKLAIKPPVSVDRPKVKPVHPAYVSPSESLTSSAAPSLRSPPTPLPHSRAYYTSWRRRPSTPYIARDARGEYGSVRELARFIRCYPDQAAPLEPREARVDPESTKELARFIKNSGKERSGVLLPEHVRGEPVLRPSTSVGSEFAASGISEKEFAVSPEPLALLIASGASVRSQGILSGIDGKDFASSPSSAAPAISSGAEKKTVISRRYSGPPSVVPSPLFSGESSSSSSIHPRSEPDTPMTPRRLSAPETTHHNDDEHPSDETLQLLLPKVYNPNPAPRQPPQHSSPNLPKRSLDLLDPGEQPRTWNPLFNLHTAASSTSELFRASMMTVARADVARMEALAVLEGRGRCQTNTNGGGGGGKVAVAGLRDSARKALPASPNPKTARGDRFESIVQGRGAEGSGNDGEREGQVRVASSRIFGYFNRP